MKVQVDFSDPHNVVTDEMVNSFRVAVTPKFFRKRKKVPVASIAVFSESSEAEVSYVNIIVDENGKVSLEKIDVEEEYVPALDRDGK